MVAAVLLLGALTASSADEQENFDRKMEAQVISAFEDSGFVLDDKTDLFSEEIHSPFENSNKTKLVNCLNKKPLTFVFDNSGLKKLRKTKLLNIPKVNTDIGIVISDWAGESRAIDLKDDDIGYLKNLRNIVALKLHSINMSERVVKEISALQILKWLDLDVNKNFANHGALYELGKLKNLKLLSLKQESGVAKDLIIYDIKFIGLLKKLECLSLIIERNDGDLEFLKELTAIKALYLHGDVSDKIFEYLEGKSSLEKLTLYPGSKKFQFVRKIHGCCPNLRGLKIYGEIWSLESESSAIESFDHLVLLNLSNAINRKLDDSEAQFIAAQKKLEHINLVGAVVDEKFIKSLADMRNLKRLVISANEKNAVQLRPSIDELESSTGCTVRLIKR